MLSPLIIDICKIFGKRFTIKLRVLLNKYIFLPTTKRASFYLLYWPDSWQRWQTFWRTARMTCPSSPFPSWSWPKRENDIHDHYFPSSNIYVLNMFQSFRTRAMQPKSCGYYSCPNTTTLKIGKYQISEWMRPDLNPQHWALVNHWLTH